MFRPASLTAAAAFIGCQALLGTPASAHSCSLEVSGFSFGTYDVFSPAPATTTGSITLTCRDVEVDTPIELSLSSGDSGTPLRRTMTKLGGKAGDILSYAVYLQGSTAIFGNRQGGGTEYDTIARRGAQFTDRILLEGVIPPRQDVSVGTYRDDLSVHVDF